MNKSLIKKILSIPLSLAIVISLLTGIGSVTKASELDMNSFTEPILITHEMTQDEYEDSLRDIETYIYDSYKLTDNYWTKFSVPYYYYPFATLTDDQKELYDKIYEILYGYIDGGEDFSQNSTGYYVTPNIHYDNLTTDEVYNVVHLIQYEHPEFYFINNLIGLNYYRNSGNVYLGIYDGFETGESRNVAAGLIKSKIEDYLSKAEAFDSQYLKEKTIHDLLCVNVVYDEDADYSQTCASVFLNGRSVCAGYSEAFEMLCNAMGISTISVSGKSHQWNEILLDGTWYGVDVTWDDQSPRILYKYFNVSDVRLRADNTSHTPVDFWSQVGRADCLYNYPDHGDEEPTSNVISKDPIQGTAVVRDGVTNSNVTIPIEYIVQGKVYRMYDPNRGEHFYTKNISEVQSLVNAGWNHEVNADFTVVSAEDDDAVPVYRLYNPNDGGMHFYTDSATEATSLRNSGWSYEGISYYVYTKSTATKGVAQYRLYNPNSTNGEHNWTTDLREREILVGLGWNNEGICWNIL